MADTPGEEFIKSLEVDGVDTVRAKKNNGKYGRYRNFVVDWLRDKKEMHAERDAESKRQEDINEKFKDYRNSGIAFSVTLISLSSALIVWIHKPVAIVFLSFAILACLCTQFFNYQGYKHTARSHFNQSTFEKAQWWFHGEDWAVYIAAGLFALSIVISLINYLWAA